MLPWYYPYAGKDDWVLERLTDLKSLDRLIQTGEYNVKDIELCIRRIFNTYNDGISEFQNLLKYTHELYYNNRPATFMIVDAIFQFVVDSDITNYLKLITWDSDNLMLARMIRVTCSYMRLPNIYNYTNQFFTEYAKVIIMVYNILNNNGEFFDIEHVAEILRDHISGKCTNTESPIVKFLDSRRKLSTDDKHADIMRVLDCIVDTVKYNQMIDNISRICNADKSQIRKICDTALVYYKNDDEERMSEFDKELVLKSFLDIFDENRPSNVAYKNIRIAFNILKNGLYYDVPENVLDALKILDDKNKTIGDFKSNDSDDEDVFEILSLLERDYEESKRIPATEAKKTEDTKNTKSNDIPIHGTAKLKGMEKGIKRSSKFSKATSKIYSDYAKYKQQEQKIDSQVSKVIVNAGKLATGTDENTVRRRVVGREKISILSILKRVLGTYAIFSYSKIAGLCTVLVKYALGKHVTERERLKIITELEQEIEIIEEKISDARSNDDKEAKYALMRSKNNLQNAIKKIKYGGRWNRITLGGIKDAKSAITNARGE